MDKAKNLGKAITGDKQDLSKVEGDLKQVTMPLPDSTFSLHVEAVLCACCAALCNYLTASHLFRCVAPNLDCSLLQDASAYGQGGIGGAGTDLKQTATDAEGMVSVIFSSVNSTTRNQR